MESLKDIFHTITIEDKAWIDIKLKQDNLDSCEYTFANNFVWGKQYQVEAGEIFGCGIFRYKKNGRCSYSFPFGNGEKKKVIEYLLTESKNNGCKLNMYPVLEQGRIQLLQWFPEMFEIEGNRDNYDYVYTVERLATLKGRKLHGKRNHIARFKDSNDWSYEPLTHDNKAECSEMAKLWINMREEKWNEDMAHEMEALERALEYFDELELIGGVLRKSGGIVAFSIGEALNDETFVVHFEKAYPDLQGAYPMINQQLVINEGQNYNYVNREEDTGDLGLRKAKLSYYPEFLVNKYTATQERIVFASEFDKEQIIKLWNIGFGDDREYINFYWENRFENNNMLVIHEDNKIVSMASFLPVNITINGEKYNAKYVYAVATIPEYQKRGLATEIINHAKDKYKEPLILQPANEGLQSYYEGLGFKNVFVEGNSKKININNEADIVNEWIIKDITPQKYKQLRDSFFENEGYVEWNEEAVKYALAENEFCNGKAFRIVDLSENTENIILFRISDNCLYILETTIDIEQLQKNIALLLEYTQTKEAYIENKGGMLWLPDEIERDVNGGYLNLTLA